MFANPAVARPVPVGLDAVRFASGAFGVAPKLTTMTDTVVGGPIWSLAVPVSRASSLLRAARPFATRSPIVFASHPEGKGAGDYGTPNRDSGTPRDKQPAGERPSERSGGYRTPDTAPTRSGGSSEKLGLASTERPDDRGSRKSGDVDRPGQSQPAPRDPDGGVTPSRRNGDNDGIGWGGGGSDSGFGGGSRNEPI